MELVEVLSIVDDNANIEVRNDDESILAKYNSKNSIPSELNDSKITGITYQNKNLTIYVAA